MKSIRRFTSICVIILLLCSSADVWSQCSVCKATAESNLNSHENKVGKGLNKGILYLMVVPYAMVGVAFYIFYKQRKKLA